MTTETMVATLKFFVNGEWRETRGGSRPLVNPSTGEVTAAAPLCTTEEVDDAVNAAAQAFPAWRDTPVFKRVQIMFKFKQILDQHVGELATLLSTEMGKTYEEARGDVLKAIEVVELACAVPVTMQGDSLMKRGRGVRHGHVPGAAGCVRWHSSVELSRHDPDGLDDAVGHHDRQHLRPQGQLPRPADLDAYGRTAG